jgi:hypothetical protein
MVWITDHGSHRYRIQTRASGCGSPDFLVLINYQQWKFGEHDVATRIGPFEFVSSAREIALVALPVQTGWWVRASASRGCFVNRCFSVLSIQDSSSVSTSSRFHGVD